MVYESYMDAWTTSHWLDLIDRNGGDFFPSAVRRARKKYLSNIFTESGCYCNIAKFNYIRDNIIMKKDLIIIDDVIAPKTAACAMWFAEGRSSLGNLVGASPSNSISKPVPKENGMAYAANVAIDVNHSSVKSDEAGRVAYLVDRLERVQRTKSSKFESDFNLWVDNTPQTFKELIEKIKEGKYSIDPKWAKKLAAQEAAQEDDADTNYWWGYGPLEGIQFHGDKMPDRAGYEKAKSELSVEFQKAKDVIKVMPVDAGLAALQAFEAWQPTGIAN